MLSVKQGSIKYHFLSLWYDSTWDWTQVSWAIGEHSDHYANVLYKEIVAHLDREIWTDWDGYEQSVIVVKSFILFLCLMGYQPS